MDRLHAYLYFLEGLYGASGPAADASGGGIARVSHWLENSRAGV